MKILLRQFLGKRHSWVVVGQETARAFINQGHAVHLFSTDGIKHLPPDLKPHLIGYTEERARTLAAGRIPSNDYDAAFSYTCLKNFPAYLSHATKNRFGYWAFEWIGKNVLPTGYAKCHTSCDFLMTPSNFAKDVFIQSGIPDNKIQVIPHGINTTQFSQSSTMPLPTTKRFKILANIAQNHKRKNIPGLLKAYGKAFTNQDDVCLILKAKDKPITYGFEVSLSSCLKDFYDRFPKHAEVKLISDFLDDMAPLYRSVDAVFTLTHTECYYIPGIEALASAKINIAPRYGGQLDFLNDDNSLLVDTKTDRADPSSMYWEAKSNALWGKPSIDDAVDKLRYAYQNFEQLNKNLEAQRPAILRQFSWEAATNKILVLAS